MPFRPNQQLPTVGNARFVLHSHYLNMVLGHCTSTHWDQYTYEFSTWYLIILKKMAWIVLTKIKL